METHEIGGMRVRERCIQDLVTIVIYGTMRSRSSTPEHHTIVGESSVCAEGSDWPGPDTTSRAMQFIDRLRCDDITLAALHVKRL